MTSPDNTVSKHMSFADSDIWPTKCMVIYPNSEENPAANDLIISYPNYIYYISLSLAFKPINSDARIRFFPPVLPRLTGWTSHLADAVLQCQCFRLRVDHRLLGKDSYQKCHESLLMLFAILCANSGKLTITMGNHQLIQKIEDTSVLNSMFSS